MFFSFTKCFKIILYSNEKIKKKAQFIHAPLKCFTDLARFENKFFKIESKFKIYSVQTWNI